MTIRTTPIRTVLLTICALALAFSQLTGCGGGGGNTDDTGSHRPRPSRDTRSGLEQMDVRSGNAISSPMPGGSSEDDSGKPRPRPSGNGAKPRDADGMPWEMYTLLADADVETAAEALEETDPKIQVRLIENLNPAELFFGPVAWNFRPRRVS